MNDHLSHAAVTVVTRVIGGRAGNPNLPATLYDPAERLRRLSPSPRNPDRFHEEKSEIAHALRELAREVGYG